MINRTFLLLGSAQAFILLLFLAFLPGCSNQMNNADQAEWRTRTALNEGWKFMKYESATSADALRYDIRPPIEHADDTKEADSKPTEAVQLDSAGQVLKAYILPTANAFIKDPAGHHQRPAGQPGADFPFVQAAFDDSAWESINLPHDWAIAGPFLEGWDAEVGGGMGRLPSHGVAWYRKKLNISEADRGKSIFLDVDGAMSYAMVWLNGQLVGGWPYGYNSWRLDLTPYLNFEGDNQLAIRLDNPNHSARWYPGGGLYRNVWLVKTHPIHVAHWGTRITTPQVSAEEATVSVTVRMENTTAEAGEVEIVTHVYAIDGNGQPVAKLPAQTLKLAAGASAEVSGSVTIKNPQLWGPPPSQRPNLYRAVTTVYQKETII
ncbi:MAG: beta galactosidase jelly roll domain-containing protein, partial [Phaeodactylibacter sp.]|nr:beta galactosidase jelly roll domain-containing protein [Phaeodactylibacter sp.]